MKKVYLIQGFLILKSSPYFQESVETDPDNITVKDLFSHFYSGYFFEDSNSPAELIGEIQGIKDCVSYLSDIKLTSEELSFALSNQKIRGTVYFDFKKVDNKFVGSYEGGWVTKGRSSCIIIETDISFFNPIQ